MAYNFPSNPTLGQVYTFNGRSWKWTGTQWLAVNVPTSSSAPVYFSAAAPKNPLQGALWYDTLNETLKIWGFLNGEIAPRWIDITSSIPTPEPPVLISSSAPQNAEPGFLWFDLLEGVLKVRVSTPGGNAWENAASSSTSCCDLVTVSVSPPPDPQQGALWFNDNTNELKVWKEAPFGTSSWILISQGTPEEESPVFVSAAPPVNPLVGYLWYDTVSDLLKIWTLGPQGGVWIAITPEPGRAPPPVLISATEPANPVNGALWYNTIQNVLYLRDNSGAPDVWITLTEVTSNPSGCTRTTVSSSPPSNPSPGDFWYDAETSNLNMWYVDVNGGQWISVVPYPQEMVTTQGGTFEGPILAGYAIPADPLAFVTIQWVQDYISSYVPSISITQLNDVDDTGLTNKSTLVYDSTTALWQTDVTILDITDGGIY